MPLMMCCMEIIEYPEGFAVNRINAPTNFWLGEFERNGYSDSDFYVIYYDAKKNVIDCYEHATTRFYGGTDIGILKRNPAAGLILEAAKGALRTVLMEHIRAADKAMVETPPVKVFKLQTEMVAKVDIKKIDKELHKKYTIPAGTHVQVIGNPTSFVHNGPSSVRVRLLDGKETFLPCDKLSLARPLMTEEQVATLATEVADRKPWLMATDHGHDPRYMGWLSAGV